MVYIVFAILYIRLSRENVSCSQILLNMKVVISLLKSPLVFFFFFCALNFITVLVAVDLSISSSRLKELVWEILLAPEMM